MVIIKIAGGLGNQMFQYALARALESKGKKVLLDCSGYKVQTQMDTMRNYELDRFSIKIEKASQKEIARYYNHRQRCFYYLRIIIDKPEGIDINDCENVNNNINDILDEADYIKEQYFLEVSSPGIERILRKNKHYNAQIGKEISVKLFKPIEKKKELIGILENFNETDGITLKVDNTTIDLKDIAVAKTIFNW